MVNNNLTYPCSMNKVCGILSSTTFLVTLIAFLRNALVI